MPTRDSSNPCTHTFADQHIHGIAGVDFATSSVDDLRDALAFLAARRTTRVTASVPTVDRTTLAGVLDRLGPLVAEGLFAGVHLEGPFIAPAYAGAHRTDAILSPTDHDGQAFIETVLEYQAVTPLVTMMTVAPEVAGFEQLIEQLVAYGITPALGHTGATAAQMRRGLDVVFDQTAEPVRITHLYNAMRSFHHRDPGPLLPIMEAVADGRAIVELIADGQHIAPALISWWLANYPRAVRFVSDSSAATLPADATPITSTTPTLGRVPLKYSAPSMGPRLTDGKTFASGGKDLLAIHDDLVSAGFDHDLVCQAMRSE